MFVDWRERRGEQAEGRGLGRVAYDVVLMTD